MRGGRTEHRRAVGLLRVKADVKAGCVDEARRHAPRHAVDDLHAPRPAIKGVQRVHAQQLPDERCLACPADADHGDHEALPKRRV